MKIAIRTENGDMVKLTNENLQVGDKVYPMTDGQIIDDVYYTTGIREAEDTLLHGFPCSPHTILEMGRDYKPYEVRTDHGYGPVEKYFKPVVNGVKPAKAHKGESSTMKLDDPQQVLRDKMGDHIGHSIDPVAGEDCITFLSNTITRKLIGLLSEQDFEKAAELYPESEEPMSDTRTRHGQKCCKCGGGYITHSQTFPTNDEKIRPVVQYLCSDCAERVADDTFSVPPQPKPIRIRSHSGTDQS